MLASRPALIAIGATLVLSIVGAVAYRAHTAALTAADAVARDARTAATAAVARAAVADSQAAALRIRAARFEAQRDSALELADSRERAADILQGEFEATAADAPDTCRTVVARASAALAAKDSTEASLRIALLSAQNAATTYRAAIDSLQPATQSLASATTHLRTADEALASAARPSLLARLKPHFGAGGAAGIDAFGRPNAVLGVTLGWSF